MKRPGQQEDESAVEYLRRVIEHLGYQSNSLLDQLPTTEAALEFFELYSHHYGTDSWEGVLDEISDGKSSRPARDFIAKHNLPTDWTIAVDTSVLIADPD